MAIDRCDSPYLDLQANLLPAAGGSVQKVAGADSWYAAGRRWKSCRYRALHASGAPDGTAPRCTVVEIMDRAGQARTR